MNEFIINGQRINWKELQEALSKNATFILGEEAKQKISLCREYLNQKLHQNKELFYGINTGFGSLCDTAIQPTELEQLQINLIRSHACGTGQIVPEHLVRAMLILKALGLSLGHSGAQLATVERLLELYNHNITPVVYEQGSLGASGDLAPLAHIALVIIGEGEVYYKGSIVPTNEAYQKEGLSPIVLQSKEGLALLNGTQFMSAYLLNAVNRGFHLLAHLNAISVLSMEALNARVEPFGEQVNAVRQQEGQVEIAANIRYLIAKSDIANRPKTQVQDPYCIRCIPQVHGASLDTLNYAVRILENEINAVTDNPTIFPETDEIISAGNFHGQPLALTLDYLAIAIAELGSISERRIYKLMHGLRGLPPFLVANPGLNSGFMIAQYTAAGIVSQNKQLCTPASVDTIDSSNGQEDHVSMGANAATKLLRVLENVYQIAGIELMAATQALELIDSPVIHPKLEKWVMTYREVVQFIADDTFMSPLMLKSKSFIENNFVEL
ncbi:MAG: histidine ammonia-lyase [Crocinitomicaceae bacterium]|nr:histidine ammonia-lyase [Crocinitomicaceae bacterium]